MTYFHQREGSINAIDQGSGNLSVIVVSSQKASHNPAMVRIWDARPQATLENIPVPCLA